MDGGPFRTPRPTQGRVVSRPVTQQKPEEARPASVEPKAVHRAAAPHHRTPKEASAPKRRFVWPVVAAVAVVVVVVSSLFIWSKLKTPALAVDSSKYQAVFFTNGQVYFGKLQPFSSESLKLKDVYYLQTQTGTDTDSEKLQEAATDQNNVQLIKLGDEIHGPQDEMVISKSQVLFYENLKSEGKVAQSIEQFKKSK